MDIGTLTARCRTAGLHAALEELATVEPGGFYLEITGIEPELPRALGFLRENNARVLAGRAPFLRRGGQVPRILPLADPVEDKRAAARDILRRSAQNLGQIGCTRVVFAIGRGVDGPPEELLRLSRAKDPEAFAPALRAWRTEQRGARERAAERLCAELFGLSRELPRTRFLLLIEADPFALLDQDLSLEILGELKGRAVRIAVDSGPLDLRTQRGDGALSDWIGRLRPHLDLLLLSDHDGTANCSLLFGSGQLHQEAWRSAFELGPTQGQLSHLPWVVLPDPELSGLPFLVEAGRLAENTFGRATDPDGG